MQITGSLKKGKIQTGDKANGSGQWKKQAVLITETQGQYPNSMLIDCFGAKLDVLNQFSDGDEVVVSYNCKTTVHNDRTYNNINLWRIASADTQQSQPQQNAPQPPAQSPPADDMDDGSDLPF